MNTPVENGGFYATVTINGDSYSGVAGDFETYGFFVVGGNTSGTETGRIYSCVKTTGGVYYVYNKDTGKYNQVDMSVWQSDTMIVFNTTASTYGNFAPNKYLPSTITSTTVDGSVLYDGVEIP